MRVFIAIPIPGPCLETLAQMQQHLQTSHAAVRWTAVGSIHLTLKFLGETNTDIISGLSESLRSACGQVDSFELSLAGMGCFPNRRNPRVVWCGIGGDMKKLEVLQKNIETASCEFGFEAENRPYSPHLTLGRVKGRKNLRTLTEKIEIGSDLQCRFHVDRFHIYKSVLQPRGAIYTILQTIELN